MNLHEYQAKRLFADYGIPVQDGDVATSAQEAVERARTLGGDGSSQCGHGDGNDANLHASK